MTKSNGRRPYKRERLLVNGFLSAAVKLMDRWRVTGVKGSLQDQLARVVLETTKLHNILRAELRLRPSTRDVKNILEENSRNQEL